MVLIVLFYRSYINLAVLYINIIFNGGTWGTFYCQYRNITHALSGTYCDF